MELGPRTDLWAPEATDALHRMWRDGATSGEIAIKLGYSRSAVLGKLSRDRLLGGGKVGPRPGIQKFKIAPAPKKNPWAPTAHSVGKHIEDINNGECKWPLYLNPSDEKLFCGAQCFGTYCPEHKKIGTDVRYTRWGVRC